MKGSNVVKEIGIEWIINDIEKLSEKIWDNRINAKDLTFDIDWYKIIFRSITIENPNFKWDIKRVYESANWYLLAK